MLVYWSLVFRKCHTDHSEDIMNLSAWGRQSVQDLKDKKCQFKLELKVICRYSRLIFKIHLDNYHGFGNHSKENLPSVIIQRFTLSWMEWKYIKQLYVYSVVTMVTNTRFHGLFCFRNCCFRARTDGLVNSRTWRANKDSLTLVRGWRLESN